MLAKSLQNNILPFAADLMICDIHKYNLFMLDTIYKICSNYQKLSFANINLSTFCPSKEMVNKLHFEQYI